MVIIDRYLVLGRIFNSFLLTNNSIIIPCDPNNAEQMGGKDDINSYEQ